MAKKRTSKKTTKAAPGKAQRPTSSGKGPARRKKTTKKKTRKKAKPKDPDGEPIDRRGRPITKREKTVFLNILKDTGSATKAAKATGRHLTSFYFIRKNDKDFELEWAEAIANWIHGNLEARLLDIAQNGYTEIEEKRERRGNVEITTERKAKQKFFPSLLFRILERRHPDYHPKSDITIKGDPDKPLTLKELTGVDMTKLSPGEKLELTRLLGKAAAATEDPAPVK